MEKLLKGITHLGKFHADDVFSSALLRILYPEIEISRVSKVPEDVSEETIVYDIGFGEYDHHQANAKVRENGIKYAAFGLLWEKLGPEIFPQEIVDLFDTEFVQEIDNHDNTGCLSCMSDAIGAFNVKEGSASNEKIDKAFFEAVDFAEVILRKKFEAYDYRLRSEKKVRELALSTSGNVLVFDEYTPYGNALNDTKIDVVIFPCQRGGFTIMPVKGRCDANGNALLFPEEWRGKTPAELSEYGLGLSFCHAAGFIASCDTLDNAKEIAKHVVV